MSRESIPEERLRDHLVQDFHHRHNSSSSRPCTTSSRFDHVPEVTLTHGGPLTPLNPEGGGSSNSRPGSMFIRSYSSSSFESDRDDDDDGMSSSGGGGSSSWDSSLSGNDVEEAVGSEVEEELPQDQEALPGTVVI